jgi:hypothetical protein
VSLRSDTATWSGVVSPLPHALTAEGWLATSAFSAGMSSATTALAIASAADDDAVVSDAATADEEEQVDDDVT